ncbi:hypothetical protein RI578_25205 [Streptomyces sp. BB1-1-1]|uniref:hypothetical protein n=1 Tax=Streptomyces sp. BB1-1-1 TaxID=3074430 RepID=UPI00287725CF|nr:hypothetical protein [Streptomyces sp. BB1-1-1]WND37383.1 hypothetical protein RI578_25205 [Streptomyces sp. BB1-1-1]
MGSLKVTLCAGVAVAAALAPIAALAPAAYAVDGSGVSVSPSTPAPGSDVELRVADCTEKTAVAVSAAFASDVRLTLAAKDGVLVGAGTVRSTMEAGAYAVRVKCGDHARKGTVTVAEQRRPAAPASPVAPVDAGGGGTARLAAADAREEARPEPPGTAHTVTGLVLAGIAAVAVALRSVRSRSRGTD